jgi:hypothetical protein
VTGEGLNTETGRPSAPHCDDDACKPFADGSALMP